MNDLRYVIRYLMRSPRFTVTSLITLALGLGACTLTYSLVNAVLLRPLPFTEPERLVWVQNWEISSLSEQTSRIDNLLDWRTHAQSFEGLEGINAFSDTKSYTLTGEGSTLRLSGVEVTQNLLDLLGIRPLLGRSFVEEECIPNGRAAVMLNHAVWVERFNRRLDIVGLELTLNGIPYSVVGVLPPDAGLDLVFGPIGNADLLLPCPLSGRYLRWGNMLSVVGRLAPGRSIEDAREELEVVHASIIESHPERKGYSPPTGPSLRGLNDQVRGRFRPAFGLLAGAVLLVWLIACINVSNLLLARADSRRQELAVRTALGASRWRLLRLTVTECLFIAVLGSAIGVFGASLATSLVASLKAFDIPMLNSVRIDAKSVAVAGVLAAVSALICGSLPAIQLVRSEPCRTLSQAGTRSLTARTGARLRRALVVSEISLACILLVGAGLLTRSLMNVLDVELGFQPDQVYSWRVDTNREFASADAQRQYFLQLIEQVGALPGVLEVGLSDTVPLGFKRHWPVRGHEISYQEGQPTGAYVRVVDDKLLATMGTPLVRGRFFEDRDDENGERVAIVSETLARNAWPGRDPIGQMASVSDNLDVKVIGIVADVVHALEERPQPDIYLNFRQLDPRFMGVPHLVVRAAPSSTSIVPEVRRRIQRFDATLPSNEFVALEAVVDAAIGPRQLIAAILALFSLSSLFLAAIGVYGVIAYSVDLRRREFGIRIAVGAQRMNVIRLVVGDMLRMVGIGAIIGLAGAFALTRVLESQLFGIVATDPVTFVGTLVGLVAIALVAGWIPARSAAAVDPMTTLRAD